MKSQLFRFARLKLDSSYSSLGLRSQIAKLAAEIRILSNLLGTQQALDCWLMKK